MVPTLTTRQLIWTYSRREDRRPSTRTRVQRDAPPCCGVQVCRHPPDFQRVYVRLRERFSNLASSHTTASRDEGWGSQVRRYGRAGEVYRYSGAVMRGSGPSGGRSAAHRFVIAVHADRRAGGCVDATTWLLCCVSPYLWTAASLQALSCERALLCALHKLTCGDVPPLPPAAIPCVCALLTGWVSLSQPVPVTSSLLPTMSESPYRARVLAYCGAAAAGRFVQHSCVCAAASDVD